MAKQDIPLWLFNGSQALLALYFLFAAAVQYNDPDPLHWMLLYITSALCSALSIFKRDSLGLLSALLGMAVIEMAITSEGFLQYLRIGHENLLTATMTADKPYIELGREFLGAAISFAVALWLRWRRVDHLSKNT